MSRIAYLESIRGLAALQVLLLHFLAAFAPSLVFALPAGARLAASIHLSPLYFLYDGYSAVYIFFALSGYVLTRSFERSQTTIPGQILARVIRLGVPALATVLVAAAVMSILGRPNLQAAQFTGSTWFANQWDAHLSASSIIVDGTVNAVFLGYSDLPGVAFLAPWQRTVGQSFVTPLWTLSIEFYGSMIVLALCRCARHSRMLWWCALLAGAVFTIRSAYVCFFVGHCLATYGCAEKPAPTSRLLPVFSLLAGIFVCVLAEVWQPDLLRRLCANEALPLFPGQFAPMQQKAFGAMLVLVGVIHLDGARRILASPWLVAHSKLSFPLYLVHWPILCGLSATFFLLLRPATGTELAGVCAIVAGICLTLVASRLFLPVDRRALEWSRLLRRRLSEVPRGARALHTMAVE